MAEDLPAREPTLTGGRHSSRGQGEEVPSARAPAAGGTGAQDASAEAGQGNAEEMPRVTFTRRQLIVTGVFIVSAVAFLYFALPRLIGLQDTWNRIQRGNGWWFALAALLEACSFLGYIALFRAVFVRGEGRIDWRESYEITMAGLAATRLFASGGAGGIALTAWALRRSGMERRIAACRMIAFMALLYGVYMLTLVIDGLGLYLGVIPGLAPFAITVVPAIFGGVIIVIFLAVSLLPGDFDRLVARWSHGGRLGRFAGSVAAAPATAATGIRTALGLIRTRDPALLGAIVWWAFDIAVLWACFHAFGASPPKGVIVMAYFVGMLGNTLPLPAGIGGVDGGMIGAFTAFGVDVEVSIVAVLAYRGFAFWLPTLPGAVAYLQLRRTVNRWQREPLRA
jgi:putative heme transporter